MLKRVLVPLDGSARAEQALPVAARLVQTVGGTVVLLRVVSIPNEFVAYVTLEPIATQTVVNATLEEARREEGFDFAFFVLVENDKKKEA